MRSAESLPVIDMSSLKSLHTKMSRTNKTHK